MNDDLNEALDHLASMVANACTVGNGWLNSMASSTYADAIECLERHGRVKIVTRASSRCIIAEWVART